MNTSEIIEKASQRAKDKWPFPWEGGNHVMRYLEAELLDAKGKWKNHRDSVINGIQINYHDRIAMIKMAGALHRFIEQLGPDFFEEGLHE